MEGCANCIKMDNRSGEILLTEAIFGKQEEGKPAGEPGKDGLRPGKRGRRNRFRWKYVLLPLGVIFLALLAALLSAALYVYANREEIKRIFVEEINKYLESPVSVQDVEAGLLREFPMVSVSFSGVEAFDHEAAGKELLFSAQRISLAIDLRDFWKKRYIIREIIVRGGDFNLKHYGGGRCNYRIWKSRNETSPVEFHLRRILLRNTLIRYRDLPARHDFQVLARSVNARGDLNAGGQNFQLAGNVQAHAMKAGGFLFLSGKKAYLDIAFTNDRKLQDFEVGKGKIVLEGLEFGLAGHIRYRKTEPFLDFSFTGNDLKVASLLALLPGTAKEKIRDYGFSGNMDFSLRLQGDYTRSPLGLHARFECSEGSVLHRPSRIKASDVCFAGEFTNGKSPGMRAARLRLEKVSARFPGGGLDGRFYLQDFEVPEICYEGELSADMASLQSFFKLFPGYACQGQVRSHVRYRNRFPSMAPKEWKASDFEGSEAEGRLFFQDFSIASRKGPALATDSLVLRFGPRTIKAEPFRLRCGKEEAVIRFFAEDFLASLFFSSPQWQLSASLRSPRFDVEEWQALLLALTDGKAGKGKEENPGRKPGRDARNLLSGLHADVEIGIDELLWKDLRAEHAEGLLRYRPSSVSVEALSFRAFQGEFSGELLWKDPLLSVAGRGEGMDIGSCFKAFGNFGQEQLTYRNIGGTLTSDFQFRARFDRERKKWERSSIGLHAQVEISDGILQNLGNMERISRFTGENDLREIRFADLQTVVEIRDECVHIQQMDVVSDAANLTFMGTHTFDNEIDYLVNIELSDLLSRRRSQRMAKEQAFGVVEPGKTRIRLPLTLKGKMPDIEVKYAMPQARKGAKERIESHQAEFRRELQEDFSKLKEKKREEQKLQRQLRQREGGRFLFDWQDSASLLKKDTVRKKYNTSEDFRIEFEDD